jgi:hypothetical protein
VFLKKWAQTKKASTKNDISVRKNKVSGVLKNQAQYARTGTRQGPDVHVKLHHQKLTFPVRKTA